MKKERGSQPLPEHYTTRPDGTIVDQTAVWDHLQALIRQGKARRGTQGPFPEDFFTRDLPTTDASIIDELLDERRNGR